MSDTPALTPIFFAHFPGRVPEGRQAAMEVLLHRLCDAGRTAWPETSLTPALFMQHLARHCPADRDPEAHLSSLSAADLYLACACAQLDRKALDAFEKHYLSHIATFLPSADVTRTLVDETRQLLREKFFLAKDGVQPKIADYSGRGSLLSWVRTAAVRTALSLHRRKTTQALPPDEDEAAMEAISVGQQPDLDYIRGRYRQEFKEAFQSALRALSVEQRNVLRLYYIDGLSIDRIGVLLGVHRSSVHRWVVDARDAILKEARRLLYERLHLSPTEFDSLAGLLRSQLDISIARVLGKEEE